MSTNYSTPDRIDPKELQGVIAEIQKISQAREGTLTFDQAREILRELNLPDELLEEALVQVKRQEAAKEQSRMNFMVTAGILLVLFVGIGGNIWWQQHQAEKLAQVEVQASNVALGANPDQPVTTLSRPSEVVYQVTLKNAPIGQRLNMACDWLSPSGEVVHQNRYQTKEITKSVWKTRCKHQIDGSAPAGNWQVTMYLDSRAIARNSFVVK